MMDNEKKTRQGIMGFVIGDIKPTLIPVFNTCAKGIIGKIESDTLDLEEIEELFLYRLHVENDKLKVTCNDLDPESLQIWINEIDACIPDAELLEYFTLEGNQDRKMRKVNEKMQKISAKILHDKKNFKKLKNLMEKPVH
jgi:hypothetical protein